MKKTIIFLAAAFALSGASMAQTFLSGDARSACEVILCLSSGQRPNECTPPLQRYFSISYKKFSDTLRGRADFLSLCPAAKTDSKMASLTNAIVNGAGSCDAASLNASQLVWQGFESDKTSYIGNALPSACSTLMTHEYTDLKNTMPRYVGLPERKGYWVASAEYAQAVKSYNIRIAAEDAAAAKRAAAAAEAERIQGRQP